MSPDRVLAEVSEAIEAAIRHLEPGATSELALTLLRDADSMARSALACTTRADERDCYCEALKSIKARCDRIVAGEFGGLEAALEMSNEARRALRL